MSAARPAAVHVDLDLDLGPDELALKVGSMRLPALLESAPRFGDAGRWSIYAALPRRTFTARDDSWAVRTSELGAGPTTSGELLSGSGDPLDALGRWMTELGLDLATGVPDGDEPPFRGGLIGHFGYDLAPRIERLPRRAERSSVLPDIAFSLYDTAVTFDQKTGRSVLSTWDILGEGPAALRERVESWRSALRAPQGPPARTRLKAAPISNFTREGYLSAVERALEYIRAGDVFQVNLSQRFEATGHIEPLDLFLRSREISPAPFAAFLGGTDHEVISASPEWFYQTRGRRIVTRPIKGTRPRGRAPAEDARLVAELLASEKDRAELTMIVDLERNDLGRVCEYGSVRVSGPFEVESFAQVHHLVATVAGRLRAESGPIEVVRALFPGGSITGAPKIRAMEIIDELEPTRRSLYTGAIGYYSYGASAFSIPIRTLLVEGDRVSYQVGGGIVADSNPEQEYEETLHKGSGLRRALEGDGG